MLGYINNLISQGGLFGDLAPYDETVVQKSMHKSETCEAIHVFGDSFEVIDFLHSKFVQLKHMICTRRK